MKPLSRKPLYQRAYESIRSAILSGQFRQGDRLIESDLAELLGISRSPVRESLRQLTQEGLVTVTPTGEVRVTELSRSDVEELLYCRSLLEQAVAELACVHATTEQLDDMRQVIHSSENADLEDPVEQLQLFTRFHEIAAASTGNSHLKRLVNQIRSQLLLMRVSALTTEQGIRKTLEEHRKIYKAIAARDPDLARSHMQRHMESNKKRYDTASSAHA